LQAFAADREDALDTCLLPIEAGMTGLPGVRLNEEQAQRLGQGQPTWVKPQQVEPIRTIPSQTNAQPEMPPWIGDATTVALYDAAGRALGLGALSLDGMLRAQRLFTWAAHSVA